MQNLADEKYIRLTTFTKDGRPKPAPVWVAPLDGGRYGFTTDLGSWKVKRITNTPSVEVTPCDARGRVSDGSPTITAIAQVHTGAELEPIAAAIKAKYGWQVTMIDLLNRFRRNRGNETCGISLTIED
jgi:PPOX class probable F420-dependent enzyme